MLCCPDWRPENPLYQREGRQRERSVEDGSGQTCFIRPGHRSVDQSGQHDFRLQHLALEVLIQTKSEKDLLDMQSDGVESIYWAGTESGLMDIYNRTTVTSLGSSTPRTARKAVQEW